ncbi:MAG: sodium:proton antiporter [Saprospiraceae bacterium]|nr:sodium:proton antiporter [Saprospiraceae bacterium]MDW8229050.1 sodium:proton antiporter [Saprospiraceae bacterium]
MMTHFFDLLAILVVLSALFAYVNHRFIRLPPAIGLMLTSLLLSLVLVGVGRIYPPLLQELVELVNEVDFADLLLEAMLGFMLFAGAIHIHLDELKKVRLPVVLFSTLSVVINTFLVGTGVFGLLQVFGLPTPYLHCLLFGALISPTDPIAVLSILKAAGVSKSVEMKIAGESLFNDGVGVVVFLSILKVAQHPEAMHWTDVATLFVQEAGGGVLLGFAAGFAGFYLMRNIDNYKVEVLLTLGVVMGSYLGAHQFHVSGPLAVVIAGLLIGNHGKRLAMSEETADYIDKFWELIDETLNAILFVLIGLELVVLSFEPTWFALGLIVIALGLASRYASIWLPAQLIRLRGAITSHTILVLTWGGLRGGISIALALKLTPELGREMWLTLTYMVVAFSILVQGLTVGRLARQ